MGEFIMRRLKIFMDQKNYMCIGNTHIFFNFNHTNLEYITSINPRSMQTIHIFITTHAAVNNDLKILIDKFKSFIVDDQQYWSKIVIHLPRRVKELKTLIETKDYSDVYIVIDKSNDLINNLGQLDNYTQEINIETRITENASLSNLIMFVTQTKKYNYKRNSEVKK